MRAKFVSGATSGATILLAATTGLAQSPQQPPALEAYGKLPAVEQMVLAPDGDKIAFIGVAGDKRRLATMTAEGKPLYAAPLEDRKVRDVIWAGGDILVITTSMTVNSFHYEDYRGELGTITAIDTATNSINTISRDRSVSLYSLDQAHGIRFLNNKWYAFIDFGRSLCKVDLKVGDCNWVASSGSLWRSWLVDPSGAVAAQEVYDSKRGDWVLKARGKDLLHKTSMRYEYYMRGFSDSTDALLVEDDTGPSPRLFEVSMTAGPPPKELWADFDWRHVLHAHNGLLLGAVNTARSDARFVDPKLTARYVASVKAFPGYQFHLVDQTDDMKKMIAFTDGGDDSGTYWYVDIDKGSAKVLGAAYPEIKARFVGPTRIVKFKAEDGLELDGVLTTPPGRAARNLPVIVMPHGGPIGIEDEIGFSWWAQAFASRGYAVFQPNYRGSGGRGLDFERKGYGEWGRKMLSDMSDGLAALATSGVVDPKRACIVGASYGGYAALAGVTLQHKLYKCSVAVSPISDVASFFNRERDRHGVLNPEARGFRASLGIDDPKAPKLNQISPVRFASGADAPILIVHGADDTVVPMEQSRNMIKALQDAGKPVEFVELKDEDHWLSRSETRLAMLKASLAFVQKHNPSD